MVRVVGVAVAVVTVAVTVAVVTAEEEGAEFGEVRVPARAEESKVDKPEGKREYEQNTKCVCVKMCEKSVCARVITRVCARVITSVCVCLCERIQDSFWRNIHSRQDAGQRIGCRSSDSGRGFCCGGVAWLCSGSSRRGARHRTHTCEVINKKQNKKKYSWTDAL